MGKTFREGDGDGIDEGTTPDVGGAAETPAPTPEPDVAPPAEDREADAPVAAEAAEDWDVDSWDGFIDDVPEHYRPVVSKLWERADKKAEESIAAQKEQLSTAYDSYMALIEASEDPRVKLLAEEKDKLEAASKEATAEYERLKAQFDEVTARQERFQRELAAEAASRFVEENPDLFDGGENEKMVEALVDEGWSPSLIPRLMKQPKSKLEKGRERNRQNPNAQQEILLWLEASNPPKDTTAKELVSGGGAPPNVSTAPAEVDDEPKSLREMSVAAAKRAMAKVNRRGRR